MVRTSYYGLPLLPRYGTAVRIESRRLVRLVTGCGPHIGCRVHSAGVAGRGRSWGRAWPARSRSVCVGVALVSRGTRPLARRARGSSASTTCVGGADDARRDSARVARDRPDSRRERHASRDRTGRDADGTDATRVRVAPTGEPDTARAGLAHTRAAGGAGGKKKNRAYNMRGGKCEKALRSQNSRKLAADLSTCLASGSA